MKPVFIVSRNDRHVLYKGLFSSYRACLESAVRDKANLKNADLSYKNLTNMNLDGAYMPGADFRHANLTGANLSEANLSAARFTNASLFNTCMAFSDMTHCDFESTSFGATDLTGSDISYACFSTLSCFSLDFDQVSAMADCRFKDGSGAISRMSRPPLVIRGYHARPIIVLDDAIKIGALTLSCNLKDRVHHLSNALINK